MSINDFQSPDHQWHPRDIASIAMLAVNLLALFVGAALYFSGGFNKSDITSRDVAQLREAIVGLQTAVRDIDNNGTKHSSKDDAIMQLQIDQNTKQIEQLQKSYAAIYDVMNELKNSVTALGDGLKKRP